MSDAKIVSTQVTDQERNGIDQEIAKFELAIRQLKHRRNNLAPISRLPPEILGKVFSFIPFGEWDNFSTSASWIAFSEVSHSWRAVAINTPELWGELPLGNVKRARTMLERSKMTDLSINYEFSNIFAPLTSPVVTFLRDVLANHLSHIGELRLKRLKPTTFAHLFKDISPSRASKLHTLSISAGYTLPSISLSEPQSTLPDDVFLETERLRHLELSACNINWDASLLRNLETLTLSHSHNRPSLKQVLAALRQMPGLKSLKMSHSLPKSGDGLVSTKETISLPRLRMLHLVGTLNEVASVLVHISIPSTVTLDLGVMEQVTTKDPQLTALLSSIVAMEKGSTRPYRSLTWKSLTPYQIQFEVYRDKASKYMSNLPDLPTLVLKMGDYSSGSCDALAHRLLSSLPLQKLESLTYETEGINYGTLARTLGTLPSLHRIRLIGEGMLSMLKAMFKTTPSQGADITLPFPALRKLWIEEARFDDNHPQDSRDALEMLQDCLIERCEYGAAIEAIHIDQCYSFDESSEKALQEIVVDVEWDGFDQLWEDMDDDDDEDDDEDDFDFDDDDDYSGGSYPSDYFY